MVYVGRAGALSGYVAVHVLLILFEKINGICWITDVDNVAYQTRFLFPRSNEAPRFTEPPGGAVVPN